MLVYISSLYMLDSLCPYIVQLTFLRTRTSLFLGNWESQMQPNMFPICIFYFHVQVNWYLCISMNTINVYLLSCVTTVILNYILCNWIVPCIVWLLFRTFWSHVQLKQYLNINYLLKSETTRLKTIHVLVKPF